MNQTATKLWRLTGVLAILLSLPRCQGGESEEGLAPQGMAPPESGAEALRDSFEAPCPRPGGPYHLALEPDPGGCSSGGWCWRHPSEPSDAFRDAWALDDSSVVAVGPPERVMHWRGGSWHYLPSATSSVLFSVWASSATDAWAVGEAGTIVHWDGVKWTQTRSGGPTLRAVFGSSAQDVWAGGDEGALLHWDGTQWRDVASGTTRAVRALWASGPQEVWVSVFDGEDTQGDVRRWNGQVWSSLPPLWGRLARGLWGSGPNDVWVVGSGGLLAHWTGTDWQEIAGAPSAHFQRVRGQGPTQLWVTGPGLWRFDGQTFHLQQYNSMSVDALNAVALGAMGPLLAVGEEGGLVRHLQGEQWEVQVSRPPTGHRSFPDVWASTPTDAWAARDDGKLLHWDGLDWSEVSGAPLMAMSTLSGTSASDVWVAGQMNGTYEAALAHFDGTRWSKTLFPEMEGFTDVWALQANAAWAVAQSGTIRRWNGSAWVTLGNMNRALYGVHGSSEDNVWVVGSGGGLFQWNGRRWVNRSFSGGSVLQAVWVSGPDDVWIAGRNRSLWHWDGLRVTRVTDAGSVRVEAFFGRGANDVWAVGDAGSILHWDGQTWSPVSSGTRWDMQGIWGAGGRLFSVGTGAVILQRDEGTGHCPGPVSRSRMGSSP